MAKTLKEALAADPALANEFRVAIEKATAEFAKSKGLSLSAEIDDADLDNVAGGSIADFLSRGIEGVRGSMGSMLIK